MCQVVAGLRFDCKGESAYESRKHHGVADLGKAKRPRRSFQEVEGRDEEDSKSLRVVLPEGPEQLSRRFLSRRRQPRQSRKKKPLKPLTRLAGACQPGLVCRGAWRPPRYQRSPRWKRKAHRQIWSCGEVPSPYLHDDLPSTCMSFIIRSSLF